MQLSYYSALHSNSFGYLLAFLTAGGWFKLQEKLWRADPLATASVLYTLYPCSKGLFVVFHTRDMTNSFGSTISSLKRSRFYSSTMFQLLK